MANEAYAKMEEEVDLSEAQKLLGPDLTEAAFRKLAGDHGTVRRGDCEKSMYHDVFALNKCLKNQSTVLLDGDWLVKLAASGKPLPRRQDLRANAVFHEPIGPPDVGTERTGPMGFKNVFVIAVSYCWASREHPDPHAYQLKKIARIIEFIRKTKDAGKKKIAVFLDWSSLFQNSGGDPRTPKEDELFQIGLKNVNIWYAHLSVFKLVLSDLPPKCQERAPYFQSGWTTFEFAVAGLISHPLNVWDAKALDEKFLSSCSSFKIMRNRAARHRLALQDPVSMEAVIMDKTFTNHSDKHFVVKKYRQTFTSVVMACDESSTLDLSADRKSKHGCAEHWSEAEWQHFFDTVMRFFVRSIGCVDLSYNETSLKNITLPPEVLALSTQSGTPLKMLKCPGPFYFPPTVPKEVEVDWTKVLEFLGPRLGGGVLPGGLVRALNNGSVSLPKALRRREDEISFTLPADFSELDEVEELSLSPMGKLLSGEISSPELFDGLTAMNHLHVSQTNLEFASWVIKLLKDAPHGRLVEIKELPGDIFMNHTTSRGLYGSLDVIKFVGEHLEVLDINPNGKGIDGDISLLSSAPRLKSVNVAFTNVSGNISVFQSLGKLEAVNISGTKCSGNISVFYGLANLKTCELISATSVHGNIAGFANSKCLEKLNCYGTKCDGDVASLQKALPNCHQIEVPEEWDKKGKHLRHG